MYKYFFVFRSVTTAQDVKMEPPPSPPPPTYVASTSPVKQSSTVTAETMQLRLELHLRWPDSLGTKNDRNRKAILVGLKVVSQAPESYKSRYYYV